jgi:hypothetical protein
MCSRYSNEPILPADMRELQYSDLDASNSMGDSSLGSRSQGHHYHQPTNRQGRQPTTTNGHSRRGSTNSILSQGDTTDEELAALTQHHPSQHQRHLAQDKPRFRDASYPGDYGRVEHIYEQPRPVAGDLNKVIAEDDDDGGGNGDEGACGDSESDEIDELGTTDVDWDGEVDDVHTSKVAGAYDTEQTLNLLDWDYY